MLIHPQIDPVALQIGPLAIHWYGLTYLAAFGLFLWLGLRRLRHEPFAFITGPGAWRRADVEARCSAVTGLSELAAARRGRVIADVRAASALTEEQSQRLSEVRSRIHGRSVELNVEVDPEVIGGIEVRIGDEVIDGTTATKLEQARRRMTG